MMASARSNSSFVLTRYVLPPRRNQKNRLPYALCSSFSVSPLIPLPFMYVTSPRRRTYESACESDEGECANNGTATSSATRASRTSLMRVSSQGLTRVVDGG